MLNLCQCGCLRELPDRPRGQKAQKFYDKQCAARWWNRKENKRAKPRVGDGDVCGHRTSATDKPYMATCPKCRKEHQVSRPAPPMGKLWIFCHNHIGLREFDGGNALYLSW
jgi:hypothetical protein